MRLLAYNKPLHGKPLHGRNFIHAGGCSCPENAPSWRTFSAPSALNRHSLAHIPNRQRWTYAAVTLVTIMDRLLEMIKARLHDGVKLYRLKYFRCIVIFYQILLQRYFCRLSFMPSPMPLSMKTTPCFSNVSGSLSMLPCLAQPVHFSGLGRDAPQPIEVAMAARPSADLAKAKRSRSAERRQSRGYRSGDSNRIAAGIEA